MDEPRASDPRDAAVVARSSLDQAFDQAIAPFRTQPRPLGILFSGGVDSSLLAFELRDLPDVRLLTLGVPGSYDLIAGREAALTLGLPWTALTVDAAEVIDFEAQLAPELRGLSEADRRVQLALGVALARSPPRTLVCGQGADELFGGYAHFRGLSPDLAQRRSDQDLEKLLHHDWPRTQRIADRMDRDVRAPYLDPQFISEIERIPSPERFPVGAPKGWFRAWAIRRGLPPSIAERPKKALQYGSGIDRILRRTRRTTFSPDRDAGAGLAGDRPGERRNVGDDEPTTPGA